MKLRVERTELETSQALPEVFKYEDSLFCPNENWKMHSTYNRNPDCSCGDTFSYFYNLPPDSVYLGLHRFHHSPPVEISA